MDALREAIYYMAPGRDGMAERLNNQGGWLLEEARLACDRWQETEDQRLLSESLS